MTEDEMRGYAAAFIDGEGHISFHVTGRGRSSKAIAFTNTDKQLFDSVVEVFEALDLPIRTYHRKRQKDNWSDTWIGYLAGGREKIELFQKIIPLKCERKAKTLADMVNSYKNEEQMEKIYEKRRNRIEVECNHCSKKFNVFPSDIARGSGKFCSRQCAFENKKIKMSVKCENCGNYYYVSPNRIGKTRFCSQRCFGFSQSERLRSIASKAAQTRWGKRENSH